MADPADVATLARKLRGKGLSDAQVVDGLRGMGFTKADASGAVTSLNPPPPPAPGPGPAASGGGRAAPPRPAATPPGPAGGFTPTMPDLSSLTLKPPRRLTGGDLGGFLAGLAVYALVLNYLRGGPEAVRGWVGAKFLNRPYSSSTAEGFTAPAADGLTSTRPRASTMT